MYKSASRNSEPLYECLAAVTFRFVPAECPTNIYLFQRARRQFLLFTRQKTQSSLKKREPECLRIRGRFVFWLLIHQIRYRLIKIQGGKNRRRGKNENDNEKRELTFKEDGQGSSRHSTFLTSLIRTCHRFCYSTKGGTSGADL